MAEIDQLQARIKLFMDLEDKYGQLFFKTPNRGWWNKIKRRWYRERTLYARECCMAAIRDQDKLYLAEQLDG